MRGKILELRLIAWYNGTVPKVQKSSLIKRTSNAFQSGLWGNPPVFEGQ
jgi:hypothetical protein